MITELFERAARAVSYDSERDFYARYNPSIAEKINQPLYRPMRQIDLNPILEIESRVYDFPWSKKTLRDCMEISHYDCVVCEQGETIVSYGVVSSGAGEAHIMNLVVSPDFQGQGHGRSMLDQLIELANCQRTKTILLEVRPSNESAIKLYLAMGFNEVGSRKEYYPGKKGREDALILALELFEDETEEINQTGETEDEQEKTTEQTTN